MGQLAAEDLETVKSLYVVGGSLSMFASVFILSSFITIKELRKRDMMQMVFWMSVADFFFTMKFWLPAVMDRLAHSVDVNGVQVGVTESGSSFCSYQAFCGQFFGLASITWYALIALNVFLAIRNSGSLKRHTMRPLYHIVVWGFAAVTTAIAWAQGQFGPSSDGTCWIEDDNSLYRLLFFGPLSLYMIGSILLLAILVRERKRLHYGSGSTFPRMVAFVAVFVLVWIWSLIFRAAEAANSDPAALRYMHAFFVSGQAFFNFCVWITSPAFQTCGLAVILRRALFGSLMKSTDNAKHRKGGVDSGNGTETNTGSNTASGGSAQQSDIESGASSQRHSMSVGGSYVNSGHSPDNLSRITAGIRRPSGDDGEPGVVRLGDGGVARFVRMDDEEDEVAHELNVLRSATMSRNVGSGGQSAYDTEMSRYQPPPLITSPSVNNNLYEETKR